MCVLMLVYLGIDRSFERKVRNLFGIAVWAVLALTLVDAVDLYNTKQDWNVIAGNCLNAIGMVLRPLPIFCIALIICRYRDKKYYGMILPFCINCLLALCIIPSGVCFIFFQRKFFLIHFTELFALSGVFLLYVCSCNPDTSGVSSEWNPGNAYNIYDCADYNRCNGA